MAHSTSPTDGVSSSGQSVQSRMPSSGSSVVAVVVAEVSGTATVVCGVSSVSSVVGSLVAVVGSVVVAGPVVTDALFDSTARGPDDDEHAATATPMKTATAAPRTKDMGCTVPGTDLRRSADHL